MRPTGHHCRGFTLIELMVVVAIVGFVLVLVAPSFSRLIQEQRLRSINTQLVTDLQFARAEAAARNRHVRVTFRKDASQSCYTIYTYAEASTARCDCLNPAPCNGALGLTAIRTVSVPSDSAVTVWPTDLLREFAIDSRNGGMFRPPSDALFVPALTTFEIETYIDASRKLKTIVGLSGRPTICKPAGSTLSAPACS